MRNGPLELVRDSRGLATLALGFEHVWLHCCCELGRRVLGCVAAASWASVSWACVATLVVASWAAAEAAAAAARII